MSNYSVLGNCPIVMNDIKGDKFEPSAQKVVDKHKQDINNKIEVLKAYKKSLLKLMVDGNDNENLWNGINQANLAKSEL